MQSCVTLQRFCLLMRESGFSGQRSAIGPRSSIIDLRSSSESSALVTQSCFCLRIADITIAVASNDPGLTLRAAGATKKFVVDEADPDVQIYAAWGDLIEHSCGEKIFDSGTLWQLYRQDSIYHFRFASPACGFLPYKIASFNLRFTSGEVYLHQPYFNPARPVYPLEYPLDELLVTNLLAAGRGVEVHACGVVDELGNSYLFAGQSGAGKTTMARLWQPEDGVTILSDDRIILRKDGNRLWMYGTPWHGEAGLSCSARAPLKQIFFLRHGNKNDLLPVGGAEAASRLFACSFPPFFSPAGLDFNLGFLEEIVRTIPCYELSFVPDERVVEFVLGRG